MSAPVRRHVKTYKRTTIREDGTIFTDLNQTFEEVHARDADSAMAPGGLPIGAATALICRWNRQAEMPGFPKFFYTIE